MLSFELLSINLYIDLLNYLHLGCSLEIQERLKEVRRMIEGQVPQDHVLLTIPAVGKLAAGIVGDIRLFPKPESFVAYCGLDPVVER